MYRYSAFYIVDTSIYWMNCIWIACTDFFFFLTRKQLLQWAKPKKQIWAQTQISVIQVYRTRDCSKPFAQKTTDNSDETSSWQIMTYKLRRWIVSPSVAQRISEWLKGHCPCSRDSFLYSQLSPLVNETLLFPAAVWTRNVSLLMCSYLALACHH